MEDWEIISFNSEQAVTQLGEQVTLRLSGVTYPKVRVVMGTYNKTTTIEGNNKEIEKETMSCAFTLPSGAEAPIYGDKVIGYRGKNWTITDITSSLYGAGFVVQVQRDKNINANPHFKGD